MLGKQKELPAETKRKLAAFGQTASREERLYMELLAERMREPNGNASEIDSFPRRSNATDSSWRKESLDFFRKLESFGCGKLIMGRRKLKTRLKWIPYGAIAVAKAFLSDEVGAAPVEHASESASGLINVNQLELQDGFHRHKFLLRKATNVHFALPLDLSKEEANRLADFIRTLPFE